MIPTKRMITKITCWPLGSDDVGDFTAYHETWTIYPKSDERFHVFFEAHNIGNDEPNSTLDYVVTGMDMLSQHLSGVQRDLVTTWEEGAEQSHAFKKGI